MRRAVQHWLTRWRHRRAPLDADGEWIALDLETTGLDTGRDAILAIAAVPCRGRRILLSRRLDLLVRAEDARIAEAVRHHRLRPADLAGGVALDEALDRLLALIGSRPLVGYRIGFDVAMLERALRARHGFGLPNRRVDVQQEYARWLRRRQPQLHPDLRLEAVAAALGLPVLARHTALGDAVTAATIHIALASGAPRR